MRMRAEGAWGDAESPRLESSSPCPPQFALCARDPRDERCPPPVLSLPPSPNHHRTIREQAHVVPLVCLLEHADANVLPDHLLRAVGRRGGIERVVREVEREFVLPALRARAAAGSRRRAAAESGSPPAPRRSTGPRTDSSSLMIVCWVSAIIVMHRLALMAAERRSVAVAEILHPPRTLFARVERSHPASWGSSSA